MRPRPDIEALGCNIGIEAGLVDFPEQTPARSLFFLRGHYHHLADGTEDSHEIGIANGALRVPLPTGAPGGATAGKTTSTVRALADTLPQSALRPG